jgi:phosphoserine phosphatase
MFGAINIVPPRARTRSACTSLRPGIISTGASHRLTQTSTEHLRLSADSFHQAVLSSEPRTAVFDCDGTLWSGDAGYEFMLWSLETGLVSRNASDWIDSRYRLYRAGELSEVAMCGEMVQLYTGLEESELRVAAARFFRRYIKARVFPEMQKLIDALRPNGCEIWAVSSTNNWVIEEGVRDFGIPPERVLSARVAIDAGRITSRLLSVPSDEGKALALKEVGLPHPDAVLGNSIHDAAMLAIARSPFAVNPTPALVEIASAHRWPIYYPSASLPDKATGPSSGPDVGA